MNRQHKASIKNEKQANTLVGNSSFHRMTDAIRDFPKNFGNFRTKRKMFVLSIVGPMLVLFFIFQVWPVYKLLILSFQNWFDVLAGKSDVWTLGNYQKLIADPVFWKVLKNTFIFTLVRVPVGLVIGLLMAMAINQTKKLRGVYVGAFYSPFLTSVVAMSLVFSYFYNPVFGLFNYILKYFGLPAQQFLSDTNLALICIVFVDLWKSIGFEIIVFLAGLQAIPDEYYAAASIDGANAFKRFRYITLPLLTPTTFLLIVSQMIFTMRIFTPIFVMTGITSASRGLIGGPLNSTNVLALYMYQAAFHLSDYSYASAIAMVLFGIVVLMTIFQFRVLRVSWEY